MTTGTERALRSRLRLYDQTRYLLDAVASKPRFMLSQLFDRFHRNTAGTILPTFALTMIPVMTAVGAAVDYSRANNIRSKLQMALDSALLTGAKNGSSNWVQLATNTFDANLSGKAKQGVTVSTSFAKDTDQIFKGTASATVPTAFLGLIKIPSLQISVHGTATATEADNSCILTLDHGQPPSHVSLTLNGAPIINLSGCSIRSNTALNCAL